MNVYSVNKGIGYASSGVEYAQKYRKELFEQLDFNDHYIFLDYLSRNITVYTDLFGYQREQVIWIYNYLSHRPARKSTYTVKKFLKSIETDKPEIVNKTKTNIEIKVNNTQHYKIWLLDDDLVDRVDYIVGGRLINVSHFDQSLNNIEYFHNGKMVKRTFYDLDGEVSYEQYYENRKITVTLINNQILYGKMAFYQYFFKQLNLHKDDAVIIDRPLDVVEGILPSLVNKVRLFSVVHAEHYNENLSKGDHILWNNNYEYIFDHADCFEAIIVATDRQNKILSSQLSKKTKIVTIPVGYIEKVNSQKSYVPYSLITASRLATEKHIDLLIKGVVLAKEKLPGLTLDIYGEGGERTKLLSIIEEYDAGSYIKLRGHQELSEIYPKYSAYVSASTSEGFGLSLLEALGAGLPLIGVDVDYGNREFIENKKNGVLFERTSLKNMPEKIAEALELFYEKKINQTGRKVSAEKAKNYLKNKISQRWLKLLKKGNLTDEN